MAENILRMIRPDKAYTPEESHLLDLMLILHAEHSSNNYTFVCRAMSSSGTDTYSAIAGAVGSLKGPLHGGANAKVMQMFRDIRAHVGTAPTDDALGAYLDQILDGEAGDRSGKIYGLGHAVYTKTDPRCEVFRAYVNHLAAEKGREDELALYANVEKIGKQLLITRGSLTTFSIANDVAKYFAIIPAMFKLAVPELNVLNIMGLATSYSAILSALIFNAIIIPCLIPLAMKGVKYRPMSSGKMLGRNMMIYGLGGIIAPFVGIKIIDLIIAPVLAALGFGM